jgi:hypothetical protein
MILNVKIKIQLGDAFSEHDRLATADRIVKMIKWEVKQIESQHLTLVSINGEIEKEEHIHNFNIQIRLPGDPHNYDDSEASDRFIYKCRCGEIEREENNDQ